MTWTRTDDSTFLFLSNPNPIAILDMNFTIPSSQQLGQKLHNYAKISATVIVFAFVILADLYILMSKGIQNFVSIAYNSGYQVGKFVHTLNNKLSEISVDLTEQNWTQLMTRFKKQIPAPVFYHPLALISDDLQQLTVTQLKEQIGTKKKYKKQELINMTLSLA